MLFTEPLQPARLLRRYKRFLADVALAEGGVATVHCPNTGALTGCAEPGLRVWISRAANPKRKYPCTWELVETAAGVRVGINTGIANALVAEALAAGRLPGLAGYAALRREAAVGQNGSRIDFLLAGAAGQCYLEVKNVTAAAAGGIALFPDAVSRRASRHLRELMAAVEAGHRAVLCFCVQRNDVAQVRPADAIDPVYGATLRQAAARGVEVMALAAAVTPEAIVLTRPLPVVCP